MQAKSILDKKKFRFEDLPSDINDPLWPEVREHLGLTQPKHLPLLIALKNERCCQGPNFNGGRAIPVLHDRYELEVIVLMPIDETKLYAIAMPQKAGLGGYNRKERVGNAKQCASANIEKQGRVLTLHEADHGVVTYPSFQKDIPLLPQIMEKAPSTWFQLLEEPFHNMVLLKIDPDSSTHRHLIASEFKFRKDSNWTINDLENVRGMLHRTINHKVPRLFIAQKDYVDAATLARREPADTALATAAKLAKEAVPVFNLQYKQLWENLPDHNIAASSSSSSSAGAAASSSSSSSPAKFSPFLSNTMTSHQRVLANMYKSLGRYFLSPLTSLLPSFLPSSFPPSLHSECLITPQL